jgi:hypothetical protein
MATRLPDSPTPKNFADAVVAAVEPIATAIAGADKRITKTEVRDGVARNRVTQEESDLAGETILRQLRRNGALRPTVGATMSGIRRRALRAGKRAADGDNRISMENAITALPSDLAKLFVHLRHPQKPAKKPRVPGGGEVPPMPPPASNPVVEFENFNAPTVSITLGRPPDGVALEMRPLQPALIALADGATAFTGRTFSCGSYQADPALVQAILRDPDRLAAFGGQLLTDPTGQGHPEAVTANGARADIADVAPRDAVRAFDLAAFGSMMRGDPEVYLAVSPLAQPLAASVVQNFNFGAQGKLLTLHWFNGDETRWEGLLAINPDTGMMRTLVMRED